MTPYYQDDAVTIYHGDCREILPTLDSVDLVLTDPPYGMKYQPDKSHPTNTRRSTREWEPIYGDDSPFGPAPWLVFSAAILWGANWYSSRLPASGGWLVFNKRGDGMPSTNDFGDCELAWTNVMGAPRLFSHMWHGGARSYSEPVLHPSQKPVALMRWCLGFVPHATMTLDPFMGSGTTLRAAKDLGRKAIGIEIEEHYCEIAADRMAQMVLV